MEEKISFIQMYNFVSYKIDLIESALGEPKELTTGQIIVSSNNSPVAALIRGYVNTLVFYLWICIRFRKKLIEKLSYIHKMTKVYKDEVFETF